MNTAQYIFKSPYTSSVQVGRLDPSSVKESSSSGADTASLLKSTNQTLQKADLAKESMVSEVKPSVSSTKVLDTYA